MNLQYIYHRLSSTDTRIDVSGPKVRLDSWLHFQPEYADGFSLSLYVKYVSFKFPQCHEYKYVMKK